MRALPGYDTLLAVPPIGDKLRSIRSRGLALAKPDDIERGVLGSTAQESRLLHRVCQNVDQLSRKPSSG